MEFNSYFNPLLKITKLSRYNFINSFFEEAGYKSGYNKGKNNTPNLKMGIPKQTIDTWFSGKRHCQFIRYFSDLTVNEEQLVAYLRSILHTKWKDLQKMYPEDNHGYIDITTNNQTDFLMSLIHEFQHIGNLRCSYVERTSDEEFIQKLRNINFAHSVTNDNKKTNLSVRLMDLYQQGRFSLLSGHVNTIKIN